MSDQPTVFLYVITQLIIAVATMRFFFGFMLCDETYQKWSARYLRHGFMHGVAHIALVGVGVGGALHYSMAAFAFEVLGDPAASIKTFQAYSFMETVSSIISVFVGFAFFWVTLCCMTECDPDSQL